MASKMTNGLSDPVIKEGVLSKRAVIKRKTLCVQNYKNRLFKLNKSSLSYYEGDLQVNYYSIIYLKILMLIV